MPGRGEFSTFPNKFPFVEVQRPLVQFQGGPNFLCAPVNFLVCGVRSSLAQFMDGPNLLRNQRICTGKVKN